MNVNCETFYLLKITNLYEKKNKFDSKNYIKDFFIRKVECTVPLPPEDVKTYIEELEQIFKEYLN